MSSGLRDKGQGLRDQGPGFRAVCHRVSSGFRVQVVPSLLLAEFMVGDLGLTIA